MTLTRFITFICFLSLFSCATRDAGWDKEVSKVAISAKEAEQLKTDAMALWKNRGNAEELKKALEKFEKLSSAQPENLEPLVYLTRGYYFLADAHTDDKDQKLKTYEKAASFGEKALATNTQFRDKVTEGKKVEDSLDVLTQKEVPAMYWTAASWGKWAKASGITAQLKYKTRIKAMISAVERLQPDYFYGAVPRYWGGFYAVAPTFAGGDINKSKEHFDKSLKMAPEYLGTKVLMAEVYWTKKGSKKDFKRALEEVLASKHDTHPEIGPENKMEKKKAQQLLQNTDDLF